MHFLIAEISGLMFDNTLLSVKFNEISHVALLKLPFCVFNCGFSFSDLGKNIDFIVLGAYD